MKWTIPIFLLSASRVHLCTKTNECTRHIFFSELGKEKKKNKRGEKCPPRFNWRAPRPDILKYQHLQICRSKFLHLIKFVQLRSQVEQKFGRVSWRDEFRCVQSVSQLGRVSGSDLLLPDRSFHNFRASKSGDR